MIIMNNIFNKKFFSQRLKEIRKAKGMTQDEVCDKSDIDVSNYSKMETGKVLPSLNSLYKLIKGVGFRPDELFEYNHFEDEKILDEMIKNIYTNYSLKKKQCLYKIMRDLEDLK